MLPLWFDGRLVKRGDPCLEVLCDATQRAICCTTARVVEGRPRHEAAHRARLARDAAALGAGEIDDGALTQAWADLSQAAFGGGDGIIRLEAHPSRAGDRAHLLGTPREIGKEAARWRALRVPTPHPGPGPHGGAKLVHLAEYEHARAYSMTFGMDESLLFDREDRLIEGARSNVIVVTRDGRVLTPAFEQGAVRGVALGVLLASVSEITPAEVRVDELREARELIAVNAVRGARPIVEFDEKPVGDGRAGPWAARFDQQLRTAD